MRLYRLHTTSGVRHAVARDGELMAIDGCPVADPGLEPVAREVAAGDRDAQRLGSLADARLAAPWRPREIVAIGLNYRDHIRGDRHGDADGAAGLRQAARPACAGPPTRSSYDPSQTNAVDWEVELGVS